GVLDVFDRGDLTQALRPEFNLVGKQASDTATIWDQAAGVIARASNQAIEDIYAQAFLNSKNRVEPQDILFQQREDVVPVFSKLNQVINSDRFKQSFGTKPVDADAVHAFLISQGVKPEELRWSGIDDLFTGDKLEANKGKVNLAVLQDTLAQRQDRIITLVKGNVPETQKLRDQADALRLRQANLTDMLAKETDTHAIGGLQEELADTERSLRSASEQLAGKMEQSRYESVTLAGPCTIYQESLFT